jgi:hypothetical protein
MAESSTQKRPFAGDLATTLMHRQEPYSACTKHGLLGSIALIWDPWDGLLAQYHQESDDWPW